MNQVVKLASSILIGIGLTASNVFAQSDEIEELKELVHSLKAQVEQYKNEVDSLKSTLKSQKPLAGEIQKIKGRVAGKEAELTVMKPKTKSKYDMRFYGYFKTDVFHDSNTTAHQEIPFWVLSGINDGGELDFTARQTRFGIETTANDINDGTLTGKLEMDFYGRIPVFGDVSGNHGYQLRTRHAYIQWKNEDWALLAGKTFEAYTLEIPETLNFGYYNFQGQLGHRRAQLRASRFIDMGNGSKLELTAALDEPVGGVHGGDIDKDGLDDGTDAEFPGLVGRTKYTFKGIGGRPTTLGLAGFYAKENVFNKDYDAYATIFSASIPLSDTLSVKGSVWQGENVDSAWGGIAQGINVTKQTAIAANGGWVQLKIKPTPKYWFNFGYSVDDPEDADLNVGQRSKNETYLFNTYYKISDPLLVAFELFQTKTGYIGAETESNTRLMGSVIFNF